MFISLSYVSLISFDLKQCIFYSLFSTFGIGLKFIDKICNSFPCTQKNERFFDQVHIIEDYIASAM
jgi:hypothetical protein